MLCLKTQVKYTLKKIIWKWDLNKYLVIIFFISILIRILSFFVVTLSIFLHVFSFSSIKTTLMMVFQLLQFTPALLCQSPLVPRHGAPDMPSPLPLSNQTSSLPLAPPLSPRPGPSIKNPPSLLPQRPLLWLTPRPLSTSLVCTAHLITSPPLHLLHQWSPLTIENLQSRPLISPLIPLNHYLTLHPLKYHMWLHPPISPSPPPPNCPFLNIPPPKNPPCPPLSPLSRGSSLSLRLCPESSSQVRLKVSDWQIGMLCVPY